MSKAKKGNPQFDDDLKELSQKLFNTTTAIGDTPSAMQTIEVCTMIATLDQRLAADGKGASWELLHTVQYQIEMIMLTIMTWNLGLEHSRMLIRASINARRHFRVKYCFQGKKSKQRKAAKRKSRKTEVVAV